MSVLPLLGVTIHDADLLCLDADALKTQHSIAIGDCFAATLAGRLGAAVVTGDPEFKQLKKAVKIRWI